MSLSLSKLEKDLHTLEQKLQVAKENWQKKKSERDFLYKQKEDVVQKVREIEKEKEKLDKVRLLLQKSANFARNQSKEQIQMLVQNALQYVFGSSFRFEIELSDPDNTKNVAAEFYAITDWEGTTIRNKPQDSRGGGVVDIISLALRIAVLESIYPRREGPILLDEPGKHVSEDYIVPMVNFLRDISENLGRQIVMVTHNTHLSESADQAYHVRLRGGESEVTLLRRLDN